jgi:3-deoxy-D-manno-octulosonic-acid transferase
LQQIYSIGIWAYQLAIRIASCWSLKAKKMIDGRRDLPFELEKIQKKEGLRIWFHCASVGEFEQGLPLQNKLKKSAKNVEFITTFFSPSGYEYAKLKFPGERYFYLPFDKHKSMQEFVKKLNPDIVFFIKYEFWFHLLKVLKDSQIRTFLVSGVFRPKQIFFRWWGIFFIERLQAFTHFFVQDQQSFDLLKRKGINNVTIAGDTRFDRVIDNAKQPFHNEKIDTFIKHKKVFVAGSVWKIDMPHLNKIIAQLNDEWRIIIVPHELGHFKQSYIEAKSFFYSNVLEDESRIMILDKIGILSKLYRVAQFSYIGGGFGKSIHNTLEAAVYGIPVLIGPRWQKFVEAKAMLDLGCAFDISDRDFEKVILPQILTNEVFNIEVRNKLYHFFLKNTNVSESIRIKVIDMLDSKMKTFFNN